MIVRDKEEVEILREGGRRLAKIMKRLSEEVRPGVTGEDMENLARELIEAGGDKAAFLGYAPEGANRPFPAALCFSINDEIVHGIPNETLKEIKDGDIVSLDMGLVHKGLITDMCTSVIAGKKQKEDVELLDATRKCLEAGINSVRDGATTGDIGFAIQKESEKYDHGLVVELGGHGVGRSVHEDPYIPNYGKKGDGEVVVEGQVLAIEPMLTRGNPKIKLMPDGYTFSTRDGSRSAQFEHTVLVTKNGCEVLTRL